MKFPCIHKFYSVNICLYLIILHAISTAGTMLIELDHPDFWLLMLGINLLTIILVPASMVLVCIELILRRFNLLKIECTNIVSSKIRKIIYAATLIAVAYSLWFWIYYYPILEQLARFD